MVAKRTSDIIPMCHPLLLKGVDVSFDWKQSEEQYRLLIEVKVKTEGSTGVEMEALTVLRLPLLLCMICVKLSIKV